MSQSKRLKKSYENFDSQKRFSLEEAIEILKKAEPAKFDESIDLSLKMGVDPKKSDQQVRGTVTLPHGSGKTIKIIVLCKGEKIQEALDAGAEFAGAEEYFEKIAKGWTDFDAVVATPDMMREVGKLGRVLGPRGLMPTPKTGTVTPDVVKAVNELKAGKIEFKVDKHGVINAAVAKVSFDAEKIIDNLMTVLTAIVRAKPASAKGHYLQSLAVATTMGPGIKIEQRVLTEI